VKALLPHLKADDRKTRRMAAVALGRLGEPESMWPLIQAGANDADPSVRLAAAEAVTRLSPDPDTALREQVWERLRTRRIARLHFVDIDLRDVMQFVREYTDTSSRVNWTALQVVGVEPSAQVSLSRRNIPICEAICLLCVKSRGPMGFSVGLGGPLRFSSVQDFVQRGRLERRERFRRAAIRQWSMHTEAGRGTLRKLEREIERLSSADIDFTDVVQFLREYARAKIDVDWPALRAAGIEQTTKVSTDVRKVTAARAMDLVLCDVSGAAAGADAALEYVVDDGVVFISTRQRVEQRMAARNRPMPRLLMTEADEDKQAAARLIAALKHKDSFVRRSAAWALGEIRPFEAMRPLIEAAAGDADAGVRRTAAMAVFRLPLEPERQWDPGTREILEARIEGDELGETPLRNVIWLLVPDEPTNLHSSWRALGADGIDINRKIAIRANEKTIAEAICLAAAAAGPDVGMVFNDGAISLARIGDMADRIQADRADRARRDALRKWALRTADGRQTLKKLEREIQIMSFEGIDFRGVIQFLREFGGARIDVDWPSLKAAGIEPTTRVNMDVRRISIGGALEALLREASGTVAGVTVVLESLVDGKTVFVSTREQMDKRIRRRKGEAEADQDREK
jgi:HEAT repeat protein